MNVKYLLTTFLLFGVSVILCAEVPPNYRYVKTWRVVDVFGQIDSIPVDTLHLNFQNDNPIDRFSIANSYNGNLGSPIQSKLYFDRPTSTDFIFSDAYFPYISTIESTTFYRTKNPFSSIAYNSGGTNYREEDDFGFLFTANPNKNLNLGMNINYLYAGGEYASMSAKRFGARFFGSYTGTHYSATAALSTNNLSHFENGGIASPTYILSPIGIETKDIPTNLVAFGNYKFNQFFYNHQYTLGFEREIRVSKDSVRMEYVPTTRFAHTLRLDDARKRYYEAAVDTSFYQNTYSAQPFTNDTATLQSVTNNFSVSMAEEFNKWLKFGLTAFVENEVQRYGFIQSDSLISRIETSTKLGGILSKQQGKQFTYSMLAEITLLGYKAGDFRLNVDLGGFFRLGKDSILLTANGFVRSDKPSHFLQTYASNHFLWNNSFNNTYKTHLGGRFAIPTRSFSLDVALENLTGLVYFGAGAMPMQYGGNIQVIAANLKQDFHLGKFGLENNIVYQISSEKSILPLPMLTLYHNLYVDMLWFKVLGVQLGANVRYHSAYYAPSYMPATGQFYTQTDVKIGNYPVVDVYLNCHLKRTRFFVEYAHLNQLFMRTAYFSMPNYPINPALVKFGLTWNFYD